jgi:hypothetical protein
MRIVCSLLAWNIKDSRMMTVYSFDSHIHHARHKVYTVSVLQASK